MSTSTNQKPMWQVSFGPAPGRCHAATSTLTILDTSAPLRKCTRPRPWPHSAVAARPLSARATATCDTLLRVTPFRGAPRASACLPSSGRPLLRHPAPPRPSVKCDTLSRVTPFRGAPRASACLPSSGRPLLRHHAPPRPSVKRATSPLPPVNRPPPLPLPHLVAATPPPPVVPDHHVSNRRWRAWI